MQKEKMLSAIVAGGGSKQYLGRELQLPDIDRMNPKTLINYTVHITPDSVQA